jgi:hypothetical protein
MNAPWWQIGVALAFAVYGGLRLLDASAPRRRSSARSSRRRFRLPTCTSRWQVTPTCRSPHITRPPALGLDALAREREIRNAAVAIVARVACTQDQEPGLVLGGDARSPPAIVVLLPAPRRAACR